MATWIDDEGRLREWPDKKHQFLRVVPLEFLDPWTSYDSWDIDLAIKLITIGCNLDIERYWEMAKGWPEGSTGLDSARAYIEVNGRGVSIAKSSIAAGLLKTPDTPANWLAWAKRKGYDVAHLKTEAATPSPAPVAVGASGDAKGWKEKAQERAHEIIKRDRQRDLFPSQKNLADEIAKEFRRDGVMGTDGKPLAGAYIKRHALIGISSAQGKQLSTAIGRGK